MDKNTVLLSFIKLYWEEFDKFSELILRKDESKKDNILEEMCHILEDNCENIVETALKLGFTQVEWDNCMDNWIQNL